ncbi:hypothetical protein [Undibacterium sp. SXout20W]|uniref:hypothetical protein n=1 Tax=Undibacterium sp. SXout20W TaxID=3413051 RepID=UPI003BF0159B
MARTTKASNAVQRLKERSTQGIYSMVTMADGRFYLTLSTAGGAPMPVHEPLEIDAFVSLVNGLEKQAPKKASKLDVAFEQKLQRSRQQEN